MLTIYFYLPPPPPFNFTPEKKWIYIQIPLTTGFGAKLLGRRKNITSKSVSDCFGVNK
jgi:hypothetical protein